VSQRRITKSANGDASLFPVGVIDASDGGWDPLQTCFMRDDHRARYSAYVNRKAEAVAAIERARTELAEALERLLSCRRRPRID